MKGTRLYSIAKMTCPRCQEGEVFKFKNAYDLKHMGEMHTHCPKCGLNYVPEPGFFFGAGYVSYALGVAIAVAISVALFPFIDWHRIEIYLSIIFGTILLLTPLMFRLSRLIWLNFFFGYKKDAIKEYETTEHSL